MQFNRSDLADFAYFLAIARNRSFRRASLELGISSSALSHALKGLEARLGVRLLNRTNRSVTLTAAGEAFRDAIADHLDAIDRAVDVLNRYRDAPAGRIRINAPEDGAALVLTPVLPLFMERYPDIEIDLSVTNRMIDVVEQGFDAGIRYGGTVPEDMIAQRLSPEVQWGVVGAPSYFEKHGHPVMPQDLARHRCLQIKLGNDRIYRWEFDKDGVEVTVAAPGMVTVDSTAVALSLARLGAALTYIAMPVVETDIAAGRLIQTLPDWASAGEGLHIYYSSRRQVPLGLKLLIELIREIRPIGL
jgi:DNA-binding transcriptional LysR family regulator